MNRKTLNIIILFLLTIFCSCKSEQQKMDNRVRSHLKEYYKTKRHSKFSDFEITKITYDTIGDGCWTYNLACLMLETPGIISDSIIRKELEQYTSQIDTSDKRLRIIANIYGTRYPDPSYSIGIIGDSLTKVSESILEVLLNICNEYETRIIDIANVAELGIRNLLNDTVLKELISSTWYLGDNDGITYSKFEPFIYSKDIKDTSITLQLLGYCLNKTIDTIHDRSLKKIYDFKDLCKYQAIKKLIINNKSYEFNLELFTLNSRIAMIKAICKSDISDELEKMLKIKYGEISYGSIDSYFYETVHGYREKAWNFGTNCIVLINNTEDVGKWDYPCGSNKKKWFHYYYYFHDVIVIYCDKQMYRRLRSLTEDKLQYNAELQQREYKNKLAEQRRLDSLQLIATKNKLKEYTNQL